MKFISIQKSGIYFIVHTTKKDQQGKLVQSPIKGIGESGKEILNPILEDVLSRAKFYINRRAKEIPLHSPCSALEIVVNVRTGTVKGYLTEGDNVRSFNLPPMPEVMETVERGNLGLLNKDNVIDELKANKGLILAIEQEIIEKQKQTHFTVLKKDPRTNSPIHMVENDDNRDAYLKVCHLLLEKLGIEQMLSSAVTGYAKMVIDVDTNTITIEKSINDSAMHKDTIELNAEKIGVYVVDVCPLPSVNNDKDTRRTRFNKEFRGVSL